MGIDVGDRRVGVAVSDPAATLATGIVVIDRRKRDALAAIGRLAKEHEVERIVVGLPLHADGSEGHGARKARRFGDALGRLTGLDVAYVDERHSTVTATEALVEGKVPWRERKGIVDRLAAQVILQSYLDGR